MSKIYEALKRARGERAQESPAAGQHPQPEAQVLPAPIEVLAAPLMEGSRPDPRSSHAGISGQYLRFDDLLKQCAEPVWQPDPTTIVFSECHVPHEGAEQFRTLRARLYQMRDVSPVKKVLITSAVAGEGKTFVATNLAQAIARERDRKVLLIDGDLRSARLHLPLGAPVSPGLSEYLRDEASEADIIKLLHRVAPLFDWVIVDSPPCLPVADASVLAGFVDGVLLVVRANSTPSATAQKARQELKKRNVIGVVLNAAEEGGPYGNYYSNGYGADQKKAKKQHTAEQKPNPSMIS